MKLYPKQLVALLLCTGILAPALAQVKNTPPAADKKTITKTVTINGSTAAPKLVNKPYENGIHMDVKGFTIKEAYLVNDEEKKIPAGNKVALNQQVSLRIILNKGFKEINAKVFPGGSEKLELSTGELILDTKDLFTAYDRTGVSPLDAMYITLKSKITDIKDKHNFVIVHFRIWDKKSADNLITGTYKLYIQ